MTLAFEANGVGISSEVVEALFEDVIADDELDGDVIADD